MRKITLIGAGSVVFAKNLLSDILQFPELANSTTICLMDIDPARLRVAEIMTRRMIAKLGVKARVEATTDRTTAISGAKYVICTIQVGGYKPGTIIDFEIPKKYGLQQTIADTLGVGGVFRSLRTIPEILKIAEDIARVGDPDCLFLNYTNPMAMNCMAVDKAVGIPHVGLCHSVQGTSKELSDIAGLDYQHITYKVAGINHMAFFLEFRYRGKDAYPLLFEALEDPARNAEKVRFEMMRRLGYFVTESSEHQSEYVPYFIHHGKEIIDAFDIPIDEYLRRCESIISTWQSTEKELLGDDKGIFIGPQSHEYGSYIIHSRETNTPRVIYGNVPNTGLIANLPHRACVELPVLVDAMGLQPTHIGELPPQLAAICLSNINVQELTVAAALTRKREHIYHAVMADPHTSATLTLDKIWAMCDDLIEAHQKEGLLGDYEPVRQHTGASAQRVGEALTGSIFPAKPILETKGCLSFALHLNNTASEPFSSTIRLSSPSPEVTFPSAENGEIRAEVAPGAKITIPFDVELTQPLKTFVLDADHISPKVIIRSYKLSDRRQITVPRLEDESSISEKGAALELSYVGNRAVSGNFAIVASDFIMHGRVSDTDVQTDEKSPWEASCLEFFFRRQEITAEILHLILMPSTGKGKVSFRNGKSPANTTLQIDKDKGGYNFQFRCPLAELKLSAEDSFLFDIIANLSALGDAHGKTKVAWNDRNDSYCRSEHFAQLIID